MATTTARTAPPRALADVSLNRILAGTDTDVSSEDETAQGQEADDARTVVGVSLGQRQAVLASPRTPAVEKQAAIEEEGGFFGGALDGVREEEADEEGSPEDEKVVAGLTPQREVSQERPHTQSRIPSPWRGLDITKKRRSILRDGLLFGRRRASTGPAEGSGEGWSKSLMSSLPSLPKNFSITSPFGNRDSNNEQADPPKPKRASVHWTQSFGSNSDRSYSDRSTRRISRQRSESESGANRLARTGSLREEEEADQEVEDLPSRPQLDRLRTRQSQLRRSASDNSLVTYRTLSRVSSLGDDSRFDDVHGQVNSRMKAIKDSWQDSNLHLPKFPTLSTFAPDFLRDRPTSLDKKDGREKPVDPMTRTPYHSAKAAVADNANGSRGHDHPHLNNALANLEGDVLVMGGYRGSVLRSAEPPHRQVWVPVKVGLNIRKVDLEVGISEEDDNKPSDKIIPDGMLSHIGPVDISRRLLKRLRGCENARQNKLRVHDYGYDWRLNPNFLSTQLLAYLESLPCNKPGVPIEQRGANVIAHSLGGLIVRHAVNQRPELFRGVVYAGVPNTCVNILGPLRNGDEVLLSSRVLTAQVNFTIRTSFALLPLDGHCFFHPDTKEEYKVDFFDPQTWIEYRLSPCIARPLPSLKSGQDNKSSSRRGSYVSAITSVLPGFSSHKETPNDNDANGRGTSDPSKATTVAYATEPDTMANRSSSGQVEAEGNISTSPQGREEGTDTNVPSPRTAVTIPRTEAIEYLTRTLASVKKFKEALAFRPEHKEKNLYPPVAVIYGKSTPTVYGARVKGREAIKRVDAYDDLAFASGDGVVLARAAMVPKGYRCAKGGIVSSERGHVTLLGDLEATGRCLEAVIRGRGRGEGCGGVKDL